ncbi:hypothetical protein L1049_027619 [Liquidambar formosana]|uniref:F-box domain-containing protein n=1 Tax=Liquidambar formosana TaxID=63359 RepID=A0AAP0RHK8_LIQFO
MGAQDLSNLMRKRLRPALSHAQRTGDYNLEDRISQLPDEILVSILSLLTYSEAAATSVLSSRWRYLWASVSRLDFDATKKLDKIGDMKSRRMERRKFVEWVHQVLQLHTCATIDEFKVCCGLDKAFQFVIDEWLKFAREKRIKRLELDLSGAGRMPVSRVLHYTFPVRISDQSRELSLKNLCTFVGFKPLKDLCLNAVDVSGEVLQYFLSYCPVLERLCVTDSECLERIGPHVFPELTKLKQLTLQLQVWRDDSLLRVTSLIKASPYLQRFVLKFMWGSPSRIRRKVRRAIRCPHQYLKEVELAGYCRRTSYLGLAVYFIDNAAALEKIIIDPRKQTYDGHPLVTCGLIGARGRIKRQLKAKVPRGVKLVIH